MPRLTDITMCTRTTPPTSTLYVVGSSTPVMSGADADENPRLSAREARNLTYKPQVPSFLQKLHAQVHGRPHDAPEPWDDVAPIDRKREREASDAVDSEDELEHAQVVVLKEGKHLSREEYVAARKSEAAEAAPDVPPVSKTTSTPDLHHKTCNTSENMVGPSTLHQTRRRQRALPEAAARNSNDLDNAKELIQAHRESAPNKRSTKRTRRPQGSLSFDPDA